MFGVCIVIRMDGETIALMKENSVKDEVIKALGALGCVKFQFLAH